MMRFVRSDYCHCPDARSESGQVIVFYVIALPVLAGLLALSVSLGGWFSSDAGVQKAADLGALAGAQYLAAQSTSTPGTPAPCSASANFSACAKTVSQASFDGESLTFCDPAGGATKDPWQPAANEVEVGVCHNGFAAILGTANIRRSAIAKWGGINGAAAPLPFTFPSQTPWPSPGSQASFVFSKGAAPGAFDLLNIGGACGGNGASQVAQCITCAQTYSLPNFTPNPPANGCAATSTCSGTGYQSAPGFKANSNPIVTAIQSLYGKVVLIPIYTSASGNGSNANYTIGGFAAFEIQNYNKSTGTLTGIFWAFLLPNTAACTGPGGNFGVYTVNIVG